MNAPGSLPLESAEDTGCRTLAICLRQLVYLIEAGVTDHATADEWIGRSKAALAAAAARGFIVWP
jgi:hypothetical protein